MAEPLTSSDIWRIQRGFGVSELASPEEKKRFAAAGVAPLTTGARQRFEEGRGISPMAGAAEKEAWVAAEVLAGRRDPMELPKTYGGLGERPEATTRRNYRMQQEWDKRYETMIQEQEAARQADMESKKFAIEQAREERQRRAEESAVEAELAKEQRDLEIETQADRAMKSILGTTLPDGQRTRSINVNEDDAVERIQSVIASNPYGMEKQIVKETIAMMLNDALSIRQRKLESQAAAIDEDTKARVGIARELAANGLSIAEFSKDGRVNFEAANTALGEAIRKKEEGKEAAIDEREQKRTLRRQKAATETELVKIKAQVGRFEKLRPTADNLRELEAARVSQGIFEDDINRINRELGEESQAPAQPVATPELSPRDQSALDWANANPDDPRSQRIKQRLGVE